MLDFYPPFRPPGTFPRKRGKEYFVPSGVNADSARRRRYWVRFKQRKCWIFIPPSALRAPSPASGEVIFRAKWHKYRALQAASVLDFYPPFRPPGTFSRKWGKESFVPSGVNTGLAKRRRYWVRFKRRKY